MAGMKALLRNNTPVAVVMFLCWFGANYYRTTIPGGAALAALVVFWLGFFGGSYLAVRQVLPAFGWAIGWTIATIVISAVIILCTLGLGFTHI